MATPSGAGLSGHHRLDHLHPLHPLRAAGGFRFLERVGIFLEAVEAAVRGDVEEVAELGREFLPGVAVPAAIAAGRDDRVAGVEELLHVDAELREVVVDRVDDAVAEGGEAAIGVAGGIEGMFRLVPQEVPAEAPFEGGEVATVERLVEAAHGLDILL